MLGGTRVPQLVWHQLRQYGENAWWCATTLVTWACYCTTFALGWSLQAPLLSYRCVPHATQRSFWRYRCKCHWPSNVLLYLAFGFVTSFHIFWGLLVIKQQLLTWRIAWIAPSNWGLALWLCLWRLGNRGCAQWNFLWCKGILQEEVPSAPHAGVDKNAGRIYKLESIPKCVSWCGLIKTRVSFKIVNACYLHSLSLNPNHPSL